MMDVSSEFQPILLRPNISYPTYQLHAFAGGRRGRGERVFKIAVLETMKWLRQRFQAFDLPAELDMPDPQDHEALDLAMLTSFHLDMGYKLEVIWLAKAKMWVLELTEPDLGAFSGLNGEERPPVPGRLFETSVSYRIADDQVECAFKTVVHEPEGTEAECEVFRLAFIKRLVRNPLVGLQQGWPIIDRAHQLDSKGDLKKFQAWIRDPDRMLPAVVAAEYRAEKVPASIFSLPVMSAERDPVLPDLPGDRLPNLSKPTAEPKLPFAVADLARYKMAYAQVFILPSDRREIFAELTGQRVGNGETLLLEPASFGGHVQRFPYAEHKINQEQNYQDIDRIVQNYPKGKAMTFGSCLFLHQAKELVQKEVLDLHQSVEDIAAVYEDRLRAQEDQRRQEQATLRTRLAEKDEKIGRLQEKITALEMEKSEICSDLAGKEQEIRRSQAEKEQAAARLQRLQARPRKPAEVPAWVERCFTGKLFFHERAKDLIQKTTPDRVNLNLLCDALEYLAEEYRDTLLGDLDEIESNQRCAQKYGRPFEVVYDQGPSIEMYPAEYKIKYHTGYKGKPVDSALNRHLRVGNDPDSLLRIYFLYDKEKKLIVVGSLPEHLRTWTYR